MKHLSPVNEKARVLARAAERRAGDAISAESGAPPAADVVALDRQGGPPQQPQGPHIPLGCSTIFSPR